MLKKLLTLTIFISVSTLNFAQSCTPDGTINSHGYYPDALDTATELQPYDMTMQIYSKRDTMVDNPFGPGQVSATIDSIIVTDVEGMPSGISYTCNPIDCRFVTLKTHCINLHGTPPQGSAGYYPINIKVTAKATIGGGFKTEVNDEVQEFGIFIKDDGISSIQTLKNSTLIAYPNPTNSELTVISHSKSSGIMSIYNTMGQVVYQKDISKNSTSTIDLNNWNKGIYKIQIRYSNGAASHLNILRN